MSADRTLVTGWFSFVHGEATAGDLLARDTLCDWLADEGVAYDVAMSPVLGGPSLDDIDASRYTHLLFVCGPAAGWQVEDLLSRFPHCVKVAVGVSVVASTPPGFDAIISRDGPAGDRPDLSLGADLPDLPPRVAVLRVHRQKEYPDGRHDAAHQTIDEVLRGRDVAVIEFDTRVDPRDLVARRTVDVEAVLAGVDAVVTTRMHGLVLALRHGVPAVAVDPVPGGAKVRRQADVLHWPAVLTVDELSVETLGRHLDWALGADARRTARMCALRGRQALADVRSELLAHVLPDGGRREVG
jgi:hypothetical protein